MRRVGLVVGPWASLEWPSLAISTLERVVADETLWSGHVRYVNFDWADWMHAASSGRIGALQYALVAGSYFGGVGEWVFADALRGGPSETSTPTAAYLRRWEASGGLPAADVAFMATEAAVFVSSVAAQLAAERFDVVGFSSTFLQNVPSLALARELKALAPDCLIVFGGANCDGEQGLAMLRNFRWVDVVVTGEGERALSALLDAIADGRGSLGVPGTASRDERGQVVVGPRAPQTDMAGLPVPNHDAYFQRLGRSPLRSQIRPGLTVEFSRGCWWGERSHCTFCGLNGESMAFRSKPSHRALAEVEHLARRHKILDFYVADNILDLRYLRSVVPRLVAADFDFRFHVETKSNLRREHLQLLAAAGMVEIQPGIESLSTKVLGLMRKGVTGPANVRLLRDACSAGITLTWNLLYGFPGEEDADYLPLVAGMDLLTHLQPPTAAFRVALERFSPYFNDPALGLPSLGAKRIYEAIYDLPTDELAALVYLHDTPEAGIGGDMEEQVLRGVAAWRAQHEAASLSHWLVDGGLVVEDRRRPDHAVEHHFEGTACVVYRVMQVPTTLDEVSGAVAALGGHEATARRGDIECALRWLDDAGLLFREGDVVVALSVPLRSADPASERLL